MKLTAQLTYPAPADRVFGMVTDPAFQGRVCQETGSLAHSVDVQTGDGEATIVTTREFPTADFPTLVKRFVGATVTVTRTDRWGPSEADGARRGTALVEIGGTPIRFTGVLSIRPADGGTVQDITGDLRASVPLIGGKIESAAAPPIRAGIDAEGRIGREWLAAHPS